MRLIMPNEGYKQCPFCKEKIRNEALKCRFCGEWLAEIPEVGTPPPDQDTLVSSEARNRPTSESGSLLPQKRDVFARILNSIGLGLLALCCLIIFLGLRGTSPHQADPYEVAKLLIELIVPVVICSALFGWLVRSLARKRKGFGLLSFSAACTFLVAISAQSFRAG